MRHPSPKTAVLSTKVPRRLRRKLERIAERRKVPISEVVRDALERTVASEERADSFTARAGDLCGLLSGPRDLSTNPEHLDGYGT